MRYVWTVAALWLWLMALVGVFNGFVALTSHLPAEGLVMWAVAALCVWVGVRLRRRAVAIGDRKRRAREAARKGWAQ